MTWTSAKLQQMTTEAGVRVEVEAETLEELAEDIKNMMAVNAVRLDDLRSLAGRATCVSSLVRVWRSIVAMSWAPLYCQRSRCHFDPMKVWRKSVDIPLKWIDASLRGTFGSLHR